MERSKRNQPYVWHTWGQRRPFYQRGKGQIAAAKKKAIESAHSEQGKSWMTRAERGSAGGFDRLGH